MKFAAIGGMAILILGSWVGLAEGSPDAKHPRVTLVTTLGEIELELFAEKAPATTRFFVGLIESGAYDGTAFYRSSTLENEGGPRLIQGGPLHNVLAGKRPRLAEFLKTVKLTPVESTSATGIRHTEGSVSMARDLSGSGHILPDLFICLGDFPELDEGGRTQPDSKGFPAFGRVTAGLDVVRQIAGEPRGGETWVPRLQGEILSEPVVIRSTRLLQPGGGH